MVVNEHGIRTGIRNYNPDTKQMEADNSYTFDSKGRIIRYKKEWGDQNETINYTWDSVDDRIIAATESYTEYGETITATYENIQIAWNEKYFNPYSLSPLEFGSYYEISVPLWGGGIFAANDYTLHEVYYNADASLSFGNEEISAQIRTTFDADQTQITVTTTMGDLITAIDSLYLLDGNGSYRQVEIYGEGGRYEVETIYNNHGELIQKYELDIERDDGEEVRSEYEYIYERDYDNQDRPIKTTYSYGRNMPASKEYEEIYIAWTTVTLPSGIEETSQSIVSVYPNPVTDYIVVDNAPAGATITINDLSGRTVCKQIHTGNKKTLSVASLPRGVYLFTLQAKNNKIVGKIIKK
jgi:hypothetical protein